MIEFGIIDRFGRKIRLSKERHNHIVERPEMENQDERIKETILDPEIVRESNHDPEVWLYYRFYEEGPVRGKFLVSIIKIQNGEGFIITSFYTDKVKEGAVIWKR